METKKVKSLSKSLIYCFLSRCPERIPILELCIILNFAFQHQINAVIGIIGLNNNCKTNGALKTIIEHFHKNCRSDDFLGYLNENKVLFILVNCDASDTPKIIDRIHLAINKQLSEQKLPNISIIYGNIVQKCRIDNTI